MDSNSLSSTLIKGISVLDLFTNEREGLTSSMVAHSLGVSRASSRRFLLSLAHLGYLEIIDKKFFLSPKCLEVSSKYLNQNPVLDVLSREVTNLSKDLDLPASIVTLQQDNVIFLCRSPLKRVYANKLSIGDLVPAHASSGGKVILANKTREDLHEWINDFGLPPINEKTITDTDAFLGECDKIQRNGYAISNEELEVGMISISFPVYNKSRAEMAVVVSSRKDGSMREIDQYLIEEMNRRAKEINKIYSAYLTHGG